MGVDTLSGGQGRDTFVWTDIRESGLGTGERDLVDRFTHLVDRIDLSGIDANLAEAGDQAFTFIGTASFTGSGGEVRLFPPRSSAISASRSSCMATATGRRT
jgi:hypothetical protein